MVCNQDLYEVVVDEREFDSLPQVAFNSGNDTFTYQIKGFSTKVIQCPVQWYSVDVIKSQGEKVVYPSANCSQPELCTLIDFSGLDFYKDVIVRVSATLSYGLPIVGLEAKV